MIYELFFHLLNILRTLIFQLFVAGLYCICASSLNHERYIGSASIYDGLSGAQESLYLLDPTAVLSKQTLEMEQVIDGTDLLKRDDRDMEMIWSSLRLAEKRGLKPTIFTFARLYAFGGGQDISYFIELGTKSDPQSLEDVPSLLLVSGAGKVYAEVSLAKDDQGNHLKDVIQYVNPILGHNISMEVPIKLQEPFKQTEKGQVQAAQYKWGNLNRLRGLKVLVSTDNPLIMKTGGFEASNAYNWNLDQWSQVFLGQLGEYVSTAQLFASSRFTAQNVLKDPSGFQGVLSALGGISRNYFAKKLVEKTVSRPCETVVLQKTYSEECTKKIARYLDLHARVVLPRASFYRRELVSPRCGKYTSGMMAALAKKGHPKTLENIEEMRRLVSQIEKALLAEDDASIVYAAARYTDIRIEAQAAWLQLALDSKDKPDPLYYSFFLEAKEDPFLRDLLDLIALEKITDLRAVAPYVGGHFHLVELARKHQVGCIPSGAGGFHCSWAIFGSPQNLGDFLTEAGLAEEISLELYEKTLGESDSQQVVLQGVIPVKVNSGPGVGVNQDFIDIYGPFYHPLPLCPDIPKATQNLVDRT